MLTLHSRKGYDSSGFFDFLLGDFVFDVFEDGKKKGQVTSKQLKQFIMRSQKSGVDVKTKYSNLFDSCKISDPNRSFDKPAHQKTNRFSISIDETGKPYCGRSCVTCKVGTMNGHKNYAFEFDNGFVIGVFGYDTAINSNFYSYAKFRLFGYDEEFNFDQKFSLSLIITEYTPDKVCGIVNVFMSAPDTQDYQNGVPQGKHVGNFELTKQGTTYKGNSMKTVYDSARYAKEFIFK